LARALIALHYQNDICHPDGKIPFAIDRAASTSTQFLEASGRALERGRQFGLIIAHVHIAFSPDYGDLPRHGRLFRKVAELGAVKLGSWGAEAYEGFEPRPDETCLIHKGNSAFFARRAASDPGSQRRDRSLGLWPCNAILGRAHSAGRGRSRFSGHGPAGLLRFGRSSGRGGRVRGHVNAGGSGGIDELALSLRR
jgi:hypothetical protein